MLPVQALPLPPDRLTSSPTTLAKMKMMELARPPPMEQPLPPRPNPMEDPCDPQQLPAAPAIASDGSIPQRVLPAHPPLAVHAKVMEIL